MTKLAAVRVGFACATKVQTISNDV